MKESCSHEEIRKLLEDKYKGYVLITCEHPRKDGTMNVEMSHGDELLAEYLLNCAFSYFDEDEIKNSDVSALH